MGCTPVTEVVGELGVDTAEVGGEGFEVLGGIDVVEDEEGAAFRVAGSDEVVVGLGTVEADLVSTRFVEVVEDEVSVPLEQAAVRRATPKMPAAALRISAI